MNLFPYTPLNKSKLPLAQFQIHFATFSVPGGGEIEYNNFGLPLFLIPYILIGKEVMPRGMHCCVVIPSWSTGARKKGKKG